MAPKYPDDLSRMADSAAAPDPALEGDQAAVPAVSTIDVQVEDDNAVIDYAQTMRVKLIQDLTAHDRMPQETRDKALLANVLNDMTSTAMAKKKLGADARQSDLNRQAQVFIATVLQQTGNHSPFEQPAASATAPAAVQAPEIPSEVVGEFTIAETELTQGLNTERYSEFTERMEPIMEAERAREEQEVLGDQTP